MIESEDGKTKKKPPKDCGVFPLEKGTFRNLPGRFWHIYLDYSIPDTLNYILVH